MPVARELYAGTHLLEANTGFPRFVTGTGWKVLSLCTHHLKRSANFLSHRSIEFICSAVAMR